MKVGFGKQKKKKSKSKKKNKSNHGDEAMVDAAVTEQPSSMQAAAGDGDMEDHPGSAKQRHKSRMELKNSLKVKVAALKGTR